MTRPTHAVVGILCATLASAAPTNALPRRANGLRPARSEEAMELTLPDMKFRQEPLRQIVEWIREKSIAADPAGVGANLILKDDPDGALGDMRLTLHVTAPTVRRALDLLATVAGLYVRRDGAAIVIGRAASAAPRGAQRPP